MGRVYSHFALTLSGTLLTLFQHCDFVSSLQDVFEERDYDLGRCNLVITGDGVAIIQYRYSCHLSGVPRRRWSVGAEPAPHPPWATDGPSPKGVRSWLGPFKIRHWNVYTPIARRIYAKLQNFTQLSPVVDKLCHGDVQEMQLVVQYLARLHADGNTRSGIQHTLS